MGCLTLIELRQDKTAIRIIGNGEGTDGIGTAVENNDAKLGSTVPDRHVLSEVDSFFQGFIALLGVVVKVEGNNGLTLGLAVRQIVDHRKPQLSVIVIPFANPGDIVGVYVQIEVRHAPVFGIDRNAWHATRFPRRRTRLTWPNRTPVGSGCPGLPPRHNSLS